MIRASDGESLDLEAEREQSSCADRTEDDE